MKKNISFILICSLLLAFLSGCTHFDETNNDNVTGDNNSDGNTTGNIGTDDGTTVDTALVHELVKYLQQMYVSYDLRTKSVEEKIDEIKECKQPLHVAFDSSSYYYVCAYYNIQHIVECTKYCCADEYTWIRFENANDITEYHNGKKILEAFQIDKSTFVKDISSNSLLVPSMEHFRLYIPKFEEGLNVNSALEFKETFIYFGSSDRDVIYHSTDWYYHRLVTLLCKCFNDNYYIPLHIYYVYPGEEEHKAYMMGMLGKYYDDLLGVIINGDHTLKDSTKVYEYYYGVINIEDFIEAIYNSEEI